MLLSSFVSKGIYGILSRANSFVAGLAGECGVKDAIFFAVLALACVLVGVVGLRLRKPISALVTGCTGFLGGYVLSACLYDKFEFLTKIGLKQEVVGLIFGAVIAIVLLFLGWKRCSYVFATVVAALGYYLAAHYISVNMFLDFTVAALFGLICLFFLKFAMILVTSAGAGPFTVSFVSQLLPKVNALQLGAEGNDVGMLVVICLAVIFVAIQLLTTRNYKFKVR